MDIIEINLIDLDPTLLRRNSMRIAVIDKCSSPSMNAALFISGLKTSELLVECISEHVLYM